MVYMVCSCYKGEKAGRHACGQTDRHTDTYLKVEQYSAETESAIVSIAQGQSEVG